MSKQKVFLKKFETCCKCWRARQYALYKILLVNKNDLILIWHLRWITNDYHKMVNSNLTFKEPNLVMSIQDINEKREPKYDSSYILEINPVFFGGILFLISILYRISSPIKFDNYFSFYQFNTLASIIILVLRILVTIWVVSIAKRQNRNPIVWGFFGFISPAIALIIIGVQKKLFAKFKIDNNIIKEENSKILCCKAVSFLNKKMYNESIRFAEKAIELSASNEIANSILSKAKVEMALNEK